ncbi:hypothetical protein [Streptomyces sp. 184]|uniref:hypothetical protein n=1 Tax=Streptomyces sp. 184 TaxID=1827526 RepID=UPI003891E3F4
MIVQLLVPRPIRTPVLCAVAATLLTGCAAEEADPSGPRPTSRAGASAPAARELRVAVTGDEVTPPPGRHAVRVGERLRIVVTADRTEEVHVHGYDLADRAAPGRPAAIDFVADRPGLYEVETHGSHLVLFQLAVR